MLQDNKAESFISKPLALLGPDKSLSLMTNGILAWVMDFVNQFLQQMPSIKFENCLHTDEMPITISQLHIHRKSLTDFYCNNLIDCCC